MKDKERGGQLSGVLKAREGSDGEVESNFAVAYS